MIIFVTIILGVVAVVCFILGLTALTDHEYKMMGSLLTGMVFCIVAIVGLIKYDYAIRYNYPANVQYGQINQMSDENIVVDMESYKNDSEDEFKGLSVGDIVKIEYVYTDLNGKYIISVEEVGQ